MATRIGTGACSSCTGSTARPAVSDEQVHDRLSHPPGGMRDERLVALGIESPRAFEQAEIAFVNQIEKRDAEFSVARRIRHDKRQIGFDQRAERVVVGQLLNPASELALLLARESGELCDLPQVRLQRDRISGERFNPSHARDINRSRSGDLEMAGDLEI